MSSFQYVCMLASFTLEDSRGFSARKTKEVRIKKSDIPKNVEVSLDNSDYIHVVEEKIASDYLIENGAGPELELPEVQDLEIHAISFS